VARYSIGIDIGGTFTDFSVVEQASGRAINLKVPTDRAAPAAGVMEGLAALARDHGVAAAEVASFVHGTTIALNTLIERNGARLGLLVTRGFRDLLVIARLRMPTPHNWRTGRPAPLLPRRHVYEVTGRLGPDGQEEEALSLAEVDAAVAAARAEGLDGLVICFLHAYRNGAHEAAARDRAASLAPGLHLCCSHEVWPRMREYERAMISIMNAYVMPRTAAYLGELESGLAARGVPARPFITQSTGGVVTARSARQRPVEMLLSGPAAGVMGAIAACGAAGVTEAVTLDVGGTSADVAFIEGGRVRMSQSEHVADFPLLMPVVGVSSIGAGGGSIVRVDAAGVLRVGPDSVGSTPGPACYGRGGALAAVTDAFLVAGHLSPEAFAGGRVTLQPALARAAMEPVGGALGLSTEAASEAVLRVAVSAIHAEISNLAARQGLDLGSRWLVPFGGAGPLLALAVAEELGMTRVLVPPAPGTLCSLGALLADVAKPFIRSVSLPLAEAGAALAEAWASLHAEATAWLREEAPELASHRLEASADMRYLGQSYEIDVDVPAAALAEGRVAELAAAFHARHRAVFSHADEAAPVELVDLRLTIRGETPKPPLRPAPPPGGSAVSRSRRIALDGELREVPVLSREAMAPGFAAEGPAIIEQMDTTTLVRPGWRMAVDASGALLLTRGDAA
jgi:N-methylhydantoinase A